MKQKPLLAGISAGLISLGLVGSADAALVSRLGGQAYYDTVADLTWLADANASVGSSFDTGAGGTSRGGRLSWSSANAWAASLNVAGVTGWRLATSDTTCRDLNCTGSEMGSLYYVEGITAATPGPFSNVQSDAYWSGTKFGTSFASAWRFNFDTGFQDASDKDFTRFAWAVHSGDVGAASAPTSPTPPTTAGCLSGGLLGLLGLIGVARRKRANP